MGKAYFRNADNRNKHTSSSDRSVISCEIERLDVKLQAILEINQIFNGKEYYEISDQEYHRIKEISKIRSK